MLDEEIGYISVVEFDRVTADQFKSKIEELQGEGMKRLIIDLRNNPGGEVTTVVSMADYILKDGGRILTVANKKARRRHTTLRMDTAWRSRWLCW